MQVIHDPRFQVSLLTCTPRPQQTIYAAMHQDYSEEFVMDEILPSESESGARIVKRLLSNKRGHYGPLEHVHIVFATAGFPHSVMQQARTHRIAISFDVQSMRYTGQRIIKAAEGTLDLEDVCYLRPCGFYTSRHGARYEYTPNNRSYDLNIIEELVRHYARRVGDVGFSEEHSRGILPFDYRQNFVVSFSLRSLLHFLDLRAKLDAQLEIVTLAMMMYEYLENWVPAIAEWYKNERFGKGLLAP